MSGHAARQWRSVQVLRGIAALMVVAFHALEQWREARPASGPQTPGPWAGGILPAGAAWPNGAAGVDLFFVISGVVMIVASARLSGREDGWRVFLCRRVERIVPLYWLATAAKLALALLLPSLARHTRPDAFNTVCSFLFVPAANAAGEVRPVLPAGWTLSFEMTFYLVFAAGLALRPRDSLRGVVLRVVLPTLAVLSLAGLGRGPGWPPVTVLADPLVLEFGAGAVLGLWLLRPHAGPRTVPAAGAALLLGIVAAFALVLLPAGTPWRRALFWGGPATLLVAALLALERGSAVRWPRALLQLGDASYAIYLAHGFVLGGLAALHLPAAWMLLAAALAGSAAAGLAVHHAVERPIADWFVRRRVGEVAANGRPVSRWMDRKQGRALSPKALPPTQTGRRNLRPAPPGPAKGREAL